MEDETISPGDMNLKEPKSRRFIVGTQKSGTTWLRDCLSVYMPFATAEWYYPDLVTSVVEWVRRYGAPLGVEGIEAAIRAASTAAFEAAVAERGEKSAYPCSEALQPLFGDRYDHAIDLLKADFPHSRIVLIVRDPRAVFNSLCHYLDYHRNGWSREIDVDQFAVTWSRQNMAWRTSVPHCIVRYEDMKSNFEDTMRMVATAMGLDSSNGALASMYARFYPIDQQRHRQPEIYRTGIVDEWRSNVAIDTSNRIAEVAKDTMQVFGYEET